MEVDYSRLKVPDLASSFQNAFNAAYNTGQTISKDIQQGREKATLNKLYGAALRPDGTIDQNKLTQGLAEAGMGASIPEAYAKQQETQLNTYKVAKAKVDQSLSQLGIVGQVMGDVKSVSDYNQGLETLKAQGVDVSRYPTPASDEDAAKNASFAASNAISASDKLSNDYKQSELYTRLKKYETELTTAQQKTDIQQQQFGVTSGETARHNLAMEEQKQAETVAKAAETAAKPPVLSEGEKITQKKQAEQNAALESELAKNKRLTEELTRTTDVNGKSVNRLEYLVDQSLGSAPEAAVKQGLGKLTGMATEAGTATKELEMAAARILSTIPYPPGAQSEKELQARKQQVGEIANPNIPIATRKALLKDLLNYASDFEQTQSKLLKSPTSNAPVEKPSIQSLVDRLPPGTTEEQKAYYIAQLKSRGLK